MRPSLNGYILTPPHKSHFQGVRLMAIESVLALGIGVFILAATPGPGVLTSVAHALSTGLLVLLALWQGFRVVCRASTPLAPQRPGD